MPDGDFDYRDALTQGPARGRGAGTNPGNRYEAARLHVSGEHLDQLARERVAQGADVSLTVLPRQVPTQVIADDTRTIINHVTTPDRLFEWSINPYRGCEHGCFYCYARPDHERLGYSCGLDFETKIVAKFDAPQMLRRELADPKWQGDMIMLSGVTDPYQPIEADLKITRGCLEVMAQCRQAVSIVTKNRLVLRDLDLLAPLAELGAARVAISLTTLDAKLAAKMEPRASSPADRLHAIRELTRAGVPVAVMTAPIIPAVNDRELPKLLEAAAEAGARASGYVVLRLPHQLKDLFQDWLQRHFPDRAAHVESLVRQMREGELYDARPKLRRRGTGPVAEQIRKVFDVFSRRHGLDGEWPRINTRAFRRPSLDGQLSLFDA
jgi:DNA repair photolyase